MKVNDKGTYTEIEMETPSGQHTFRAAQKTEDRRYWNRDPETCELAKFMADNSKTTQVVVKCDDVYAKIR